MISHKGVGEGSHSYQDTRSEGGVTSVITPLPLREGKGEGPTGAGGEATVHSVRDNVFLSSKPFKKKKRPSPRSTVISE